VLLLLLLLQVVPLLLLLVLVLDAVNNDLIRSNLLLFLFGVVVGGGTIIDIVRHHVLLDIYQNGASERGRSLQQVIGRATDHLTTCPARWAPVERLALDQVAHVPQQIL
jgi:hypothetical protein